MGSTRGVIHNRNRAKQIINFGGLLYGNITPTDIDGSIDFHGKCLVFIEYKYRDTPLPAGQRLAFERIASGRSEPSIFIVASHNIYNPDQDIDGATSLVREYFFSGKWRVPREQYSVKRMIDEFVGKHAPECLFLREDRNVNDAILREVSL